VYKSQVLDDFKQDGFTWCNMVQHHQMIASTMVRIRDLEIRVRDHRIDAAVFSSTFLGHALPRAAKITAHPPPKKSKQNAKRCQESWHKWTGSMPGKKLHHLHKDSEILLQVASICYIF
jgi:hypothetical protein